MMKYFRDLFKIILFVLIIYIPFICWDIYDDLNSIEESTNKETIVRINSLKEQVNNFISEGRLLEACQRLTAERNSENIFFFSLKSKDVNCQDPPDAKQQITAPEMNKILKVMNERSTQYFIYSNEYKDVVWTTLASVRIVRLFGHSSSEQDSILLTSILKNLSLVIYIVFMFAFLAILILSKSIQNQFRKNGKDPLFLTIVQKLFGWLQLQDLKIVQAATTAILRKNDDLIKDQDLLETSLEASILNEIRLNNHNLPYSFRGTVAKVDINGFSKVVSSGHSKEAQNLTRLLEDFGCELLLRYKGLFEKTVGDEIVVVFKSDDSVLLAAAFARDLMFEFSKLEFDFKTEKRKFTLKSSISSSEITFSKRAPGFGFLGDALTYTTRLLDVVTIKDRNILSCLKSQASQIQNLVIIPSELRRFEFKNMVSDEGYLIEQFIQLQDVYSTQPELVRYFRSNESLIFLLHKVQVENDHDKLNYIFATFCDLTILCTTAGVIAAWIETLKVFEKRVYQYPSLAFSFSRLIIEGSRLIPTAQWNASCTDAIVAISRYIEGRINASVVDVLIEKDLNLIAIEQEKSFIIEADQSFRTRGNLLLNQAIHQLSDTSLEKIIKMINSKNTLESSTGVYCACRVIIYYRKKNPAELETFMSYQKLSKILHDLYLMKNKDISPRLLKLLDQVNSYNELTYKEVSL